MAENPIHTNRVSAGGNTFIVAQDRSINDNSSHYLGDTYITNNHYAPYARSGLPRHPLDRLEEWVSKGAAHDSAERGTDAPKCYPETRKAVQGEMLSHIDPGGEEKILWLSGPAGAGKTAIMGSVADVCQQQKWLAASFYFSSSANVSDRCSKRYLIPTLAYHFFQLKIPGLPAAILASIDANPSVFDKQLQQQVEILLLSPLREVAQTVDPSTWPKVVIVDGLDECSADQGTHYGAKEERQMSRDRNHEEILAALKQASDDTAFPFRVIVASRPERAIEQYFSLSTSLPIRRIFLDQKYSPEADIKLYASATLMKMGLERRLGNDWFAQVGRMQGIIDVPQHLAEESSGQFIYVATVMRFLQGNPTTPSERLQWVLNWRCANGSKPFAALDALYTGILHTSPDPTSAVVLIRALQSLVTSGNPAAFSQIAHAHAFLQPSPGHHAQILGPLSSIVRTVNDHGEPDFYLYHKSFTDFLEDPGRSGDLYVLEAKLRDVACSRYYDILQNKGPQFPLSEHDRYHFLGLFCKSFPYQLPSLTERKYRFAAKDVDWWIAELEPDDLYELFIYVYVTVHHRCTGLTPCRQSCKVWRGGLVRHAKANGWRVPTTLERLRDRLRAFSVDSIGDVFHPPEG